MIQGVLIGDPNWGLALRSTLNTTVGKTYGVVWPPGYSARREQGVTLLVGSGGGVVAREGDALQMAPGNEEDGVVYPCEPITSVPN